MELAIPLVALGSLYVVNNQKKKAKQEAFRNGDALPNTDIPDVNYSTEYSETESDMTQSSRLSTTNKYSGGGAYTDKYFSPESNSQYDGEPQNKNASYQSLTGESVDKNYFQHNNMVPYFGSTIRSRQIDANSNESVLDSMAGSGSQTFAKGEQAPLFAPSENYQWAYGAPNQSDFMQSRMNVSMRMANVKPFEEERVAPGLGLGYTTAGAGGFNSGMAMRDHWLDKNVDQLRVGNKLKPTGLMLLGHEGPAMSRVTNLGGIGQMEKNRPDKDFAMGPERYFTTTGAGGSASTLHAIPVDRYVSRPETTMEYTGGAGYANEATYVPGEYKPSTNIELGAVPMAGANAQGRNYAHDAEFGIKSSKAYMNNRAANKQDDYFGAIGGAFGAAVAPLMDVLRPSRKENTIGSLRPYQNAKSAVGQSYLFNPADKPAPTIRETTENSKFHLNVNANQNGGAYKVTEHQAVDNNRQTTDDFYYAGGASAGERGRQARPYDAEYRQRNNDIKSSTIKGRMVPGNMSLMNNSVNMREAERDHHLKMNRAAVPTMPYQTPNIDNMGILQGNDGLYSTIQMDRTTPDIMNALQKNPYALSVMGGL
uniref:DUF5899 domain-containing protein n=1 Tax=viral metagenome TaxID=1070528 RepID=A0A6C0KHL1_9ZZZZ